MARRVQRSLALRHKLRGRTLQVLLDYVDVGFGNLGFVVVIRSRRD